MKVESNLSVEIDNTESFSGELRQTVKGLTGEIKIFLDYHETIRLFKILKNQDCRKNSVCDSFCDNLMNELKKAGI